jgi:hypothetical protein
MNELQTVQNMLQSYQGQMDEIHKFVGNLGKAPAQEVAPPVAAIPESPEQLTAEQHRMLLGLFKAFIADTTRDGAKELTSGLSKFGRFAQSEFDKLTSKT